MKKYFKSVTAALLGVTFAFSAVGCGGGDDKKPAKKIGVEDYYNSLVTCMDTTETFHISTSRKKGAIVANKTDIVVVAGQNGFNLKTHDEYFDEAGQKAYESDSLVIDGVTYTTQEGGNGKGLTVATKAPSTNVIEPEVPTMPAMPDFADMAKEDVIALLKEGKAENGVYTVTMEYDFTDSVKDVFAFLKKIQPEQEDGSKTTLENVVDLLLKELGYPATVNAQFLLETFASYGEMKVSDVIASVEEALGMTLEEFKNKMFADEAMVELIKELTAMSGSEDATNAQTAAQILAIMTTLKDSTVDSLIADYKDLTLDQILAVVYGMIAGESTPTPGDDPELMSDEFVTDGTETGTEEVAPEMTFASLAEMIGGFLAMDFATFEELVGVGVFTEILPVLQMMEVEKFACSATVAFDTKTGDLLNVGGEFGYAVSATMQGQTQKMEETYAFAVEFSEEKTTISAPASFVYDFTNEIRGFILTGAEIAFDETYLNGEEIWFTFEGQTEDGTIYNCTVSFAAPTTLEIPTSAAVTVESLSVYEVEEDGSGFWLSCSKDEYNFSTELARLGLKASATITMSSVYAPTLEMDFSRLFA